MSHREQVLQEALALPPEDRVFVADQLEQSLSHGEFASPEISAAWNDEIERRLAAYDRGESQSADADAALEAMRRILIEHRARKVSS
jgi:putative addiction module component (TIGR02574 family)